MRGKNRRTVIILLSTVVVVVGCSTSSASLAPSPPMSAAAASIETLVLTVTPTATPATAIATARPTATATSSTTPGKTLVDTAVVTVVDGVRVRSKPRISDDSFKYEPLLPLGTELYVLGGPVSASGYDWYEVAALTSRTLPSGWVARAGRDGEPWIAPGALDCPPIPTDFRSLAALPPGVGLACFPRMPITVQARLVECNCDVDGGWFDPSWFTWGGGPLLVEPAQTQPPADTADWFGLHMDPTGEHPDVLPVGKYLGDTSWSRPEGVEVTGIFDHPAAAKCTYTEMGGEPAPSQGCRLAFAVTRLVTVRP